MEYKKDYIKFRVYDEYNDIIENIRKNETENIFFSFPVQTNNQEGIEVSVFYK